MVNIISYQDDQNFAIELLPLDKQHEIILLKSEKKFNSISEMSLHIENLKEKGKKEKYDPKINWRYQFRDEDEIIIPKINFNIETNYSSLEGKDFNSNSQNFKILMAWQRTAFILDESGSKLDSESAIACEAVEEEGFEIPLPKKMIFNQPFLVLLKRKESKNPYFGLWLTNTELMTKE